MNTISFELMNSLFKILKNSSTEFTSSEKDISTRNLKFLKIESIIVSKSLVLMSVIS